MLIRLLHNAPKLALKAWARTVVSKPNAIKDVPLPMLEGWLDDPNASVWKIIENKLDETDILTSLFCSIITEDKASYILFEESAVTAAGLLLTSSNGKTSDNSLNTSGSHHEIRDLTGLKLCHLLIAIANSNFRLESAEKRQLMATLLEAGRKYKKTAKPSTASTAVPTPEPAPAGTQLAAQVQIQTVTNSPTSSTYEPNIGAPADSTAPTDPKTLP